MVEGKTVPERADAALAASIFHDGHYTIREAKEHLERAGVAVRRVPMEETA